MAKIITAAEAADLIRDGMTLGVSGFGAFASPDCVMEAMSRKFKEQNTPRDLTIVSGVAPGDFVEDGCGLSKIKDEGIIKTLIASHLRMSPAIGRACSENKIAAFSMPLGVYGQLMNAIGSKRPGIITHVGLNTYADPRQDGCKMNELAKADGREMVELIHVSGKDYLFYKAFHIDACILHASYADTEGNISLQNEPVHGDLLELALAVHNNGGIVIVEVNSICEAGALDPRHVLIHKSCVDYIVKAEGENNVALAYHPEMVGDIRGLAGDVAPLPFGYKKVIARRAAMELKQGALVNLGIGIPASVANVANEEGLSRDVTLSLETGVFGGVPLDGPLFGAAVNPDSISRSADTFSLYDGGGLDMTVLGCAEVDATGDRPLRQRERVQVLRPLRRPRRLCQYLAEHPEDLLCLCLQLRKVRHWYRGRQAGYPPRWKTRQVYPQVRPYHLLLAVCAGYPSGGPVHNRTRGVPSGRPQDDPHRDRTRR